MYIARTRAGSTAGSSRLAVAAGRLVAAVERRATAPATAAGDVAVRLDDEVRAVVDQLRVDAHDRPAGRDLGVVEEAALQLGDRSVHQRRQRWDIRRHRQSARRNAPIRSASAWTPPRSERVNRRAGSTVSSTLFVVFLRLQIPAQTPSMIRNGMAAGPS